MGVWTGGMCVNIGKWTNEASAGVGDMTGWEPGS